MSLQLDARQRAMLEEIGIRLFWPDAKPDAAAQAEVAPPARVESAPAPAVPVAARAEAPLRPAVPAVPAVPADPPVIARVPADVGALAWDELQQAVEAWAAAHRRKAVFGTGDLRPDWLCVGEPPSEEDELQGVPFAGDAGKLLDNMLLAVGAGRQRGAYLTNAFKCRVPGELAQDPGELARSAAFLQRQVELLQPRVILALGRFPIQVLLQATEPLGKLRGRVHRFAGVPVVVSYPPSYLLRTPADKARAWADLCLARSLLAA